MTVQAYQIWWRLHVRVARGEELGPDEQQAYDAGTAELDSEEHVPVTLESLRLLRERVDALKRNEAQMLSEQRS